MKIIFSAALKGSGTARGSMFKVPFLSPYILGEAAVLVPISGGFQYGIGRLADPVPENGQIVYGIEENNMG